MRPVLLVGGVLAAMLVGCGDPSPEIGEPGDAYRAGVASACEESGRDDDERCDEAADTMIEPRALPDDADDAEFSFGYVDACRYLYDHCDPTELERESNQVRKFFEE